MARTGPRTAARQGIVLAHGRGGSGQDVLGLIAAAGLTDVAAVAPDAPGQSWWPTSFLAPTAEIAPFVAKGIAAMLAGVAALEAEGLARHRIWLGGFSQGACLALETFARNCACLAGVVALSGGLVGTADADQTGHDALYGHRAKAFDYAGRLDGGRVWISVHERDPHIPLARAKESAAVLQAMGAEVTATVYPGAGHQVMAADIAALRQMLKG